MNEYIKRDSLLEEIKVKVNTLYKFRSLYTDQSARAFEELAKYITKLPAADVAPVVHGTWSLENDEEMPNFMFKLVICSACGEKANHTYNYCPNCGAKMDGGK